MLRCELCNDQSVVMKKKFYPGWTLRKWEILEVRKMRFSEDLQISLRILRHFEQLPVRSFWWNNDAFVRLRPFCTCSSIGNQVDGLPIVLSKDAVSASSIFLGRAPIHDKRWKKMNLRKCMKKSALWICVFQGFGIAMLRCELSDDWDDVKEQKFHSHFGIIFFFISEGHTNEIFRSFSNEASNSQKC